MVLLIGYGNPGRGDDGLGPALAERIERRALPFVEVKIDFQLKVEHALAVAETDVVVFADAWIAGRQPYALAELHGDPLARIDSHEVSPASVLSLARLLFGSTARGFTLAITGAEYGDIKEGLSVPAARNLDLAEAFLLDWLSKPLGAARPTTEEA